MNRVIQSLMHASGCRVSLVLGDITTEEVDAIVNAANSRLMHGGGVAGAIVRAGGEIIQQESYALAPVPVGHSVITTGGDLPAAHVIHTVGPRWGEGDEEAKLKSAVGTALTLAGSKGLTSISMPAISTGIFGFPLEAAVTVILGSLREVLDSGRASSLKEVRICLFDQKAVQAFESQWAGAWGVGSL